MKANWHLCVPSQILVYCSLVSEVGQKGFPTHCLMLSFSCTISRENLCWNVLGCQNAVAPEMPSCLEITLIPKKIILLCVVKSLSLHLLPSNFCCLDFYKIGLCPIQCDMFMHLKLTIAYLLV